MGQHLVEAVPVGRAGLLFDGPAGGFPVVVVDLETESLRAKGDRPPDAAVPDEREGGAVHS